MGNIQYITTGMINEVMSCRISIDKPEIGMVGTYFVGSDRYAVVVTEVINKRTIRIEHLKDEDYDHYIITGQDNIQRLDPRRIGNYVYADIHENKIMPYGRIFTFRKNKRWMEQGQGCWGTGSVHLGYAENYRDPNF